MNNAFKITHPEIPTMIYWGDDAKHVLSKVIADDKQYDLDIDFSKYEAHRFKEADEKTFAEPGVNGCLFDQWESLNELGFFMPKN